LLVVGQYDTFFTPEEALATGLQTHVFDGAGHLPMMERPDAFNRLLDELL